MRPAVRAEKYIRDASGAEKTDNGTDGQTDRQSATHNAAPSYGGGPHNKKICGGMAATIYDPPRVRTSYRKILTLAITTRLYTFQKTQAWVLLYSCVGKVPLLFFVFMCISLLHIRCSLLHLMRKRLHNNHVSAEQTISSSVCESIFLRKKLVTRAV